MIGDQYIISSVFDKYLVSRPVAFPGGTDNLVL